MKPYATLKLTEEEFASLHGAAKRSREYVADKLGAAKDPGEEQDFYQERVEMWDGFLARFDAILIADTSQDEEDEDEDEDEDE